MAAAESHAAFRANVLTVHPGADLSAVAVRARAREALEAGGIVLLSRHGFELTERERKLVADPAAMLVNHDEPRKRSGKPTIVYDPVRRKLKWHFARVKGKAVRARVRPSESAHVEAMLDRFGHWSESLLLELFPSYRSALARHRITYRPFLRDSAQKLHVDAAYGFPTEGRGILRLFCNVNPGGWPRSWQVGESFEPFASRFLPSVPLRRPRPASLLASRLGVAKGRPTVYDRLMTDLKRASVHDRAYQRRAPREQIDFPNGTCWIVLTDLVVHGALAGQHSIDQTWFLPVEARSDPSRSSLGILERLTGQALV